MSPLQIPQADVSQWVTQTLTVSVLRLCPRKEKTLQTQWSGVLQFWVLSPATQMCWLVQWP